MAFTLNHNSTLVVVESPGGLYNAEQLRVVAELAHRSEVAMVRALEDQRLGLVLKSGKEAAVTEELSQVGLSIRPYQSGLHQPVACMGTLCPSSHMDVIRASLEISDLVNRFASSQPLKIGLNGCGRSCVPTHTLDISIVADNHGYRLSVGGKNEVFPEFATFIANGIPAEELSAQVEKILSLYDEQSEENESFHQFFERVGISPFVKALHPFSRDAGGQDLMAGLNESETGMSEASNTELPELNDELDFADVPHAEELEELEVAPLLVEEDSELLTEEITLGENFMGENEAEMGLSDASEMEPEQFDEAPLDFQDIDDQIDNSDKGVMAGSHDFEDGTEDLNVDVLDEKMLPPLDIADEESLEEDSLEAKIAQSIDEESMITYDDKADRQRLQALQMVEDIVDQEEVSEPNDDFSDTELHDDFSGALSEDLDFESSSSSAPNGFAIRGVNQEGSKVTVNLSTGASITIDILQLQSMSGRLELVFNKQRVSLIEVDGVIVLKANGIEFKLPCQVMAA